MESLLNEFGTFVDNGGPAPSDYGRVNRIMNALGDLMRKGILNGLNLPLIWDMFGEAFSLKTMQGHVCRKPHGYAGDFEVIDKLYLRKTSTDPRLANWDHYFHSQKAVKAVRNRKGYFKKLLFDIERNNQHRTIHVLNIGSGPGRDMYEYFNETPGTNVHIDCVDIDKNAIQYAQSLCNRYRERIKFHNRNILRFRPDKKYDLIWSAGLFDYLSDNLFCYLISNLIKHVKSDGAMVIGNFSKNNPCRSYMEFGQWFLIHRSEEHLKSLAMHCDIAESKISIGQEQEGVNLFMHIHK